MSKILIASIFILFISSFFIGCEGEKVATSGDNGNSDVFESETKKALVPASRGGVVKTASGSVSVDIPGGALLVDTEITIVSESKKDQPMESSLGSNVFNFGPDGLQFSKPVTLTIKLGADVPEGKVATISVLEGKDWFIVAQGDPRMAGDPRMITTGDQITTEVSHFSKYAVVFRDKTIQEPCKESYFTPCGGDVTGVWIVKDGCVEHMPGEDFPDVCKDMTEFVFDVDWNDTWIEFSEDNTFSAVLEPEILSSEVYYGDFCMDELSESKSSAEQFCRILDSDDRASCSYENGICKCVTAFSDVERVEDSGSYRTENNKIFLDEDENDTVTVEYCIEENIMRGKFVDTESDGSSKTVYYLMEKSVQ